MQDLIFGNYTEADLNAKNVKVPDSRTCPKNKIIQGVKVFPQRTLNAYYTDYALSHPNSSWHPGDYIAHVAGGVDKLEIIKRLIRCMKAKGDNLRGCEINGSFKK